MRLTREAMATEDSLDRTTLLTLKGLFWPLWKTPISEIKFKAESAEYENEQGDWSADDWCRL